MVAADVWAKTACPRSCRDLRSDTAVVLVEVLLDAALDEVALRLWVAVSGEVADVVKVLDVLVVLPGAVGALALGPPPLRRSPFRERVKTAESLSKSRRDLEPTWSCCRRVPRLWRDVHVALPLCRLSLEPDKWRAALRRESTRSGPGRDTFASWVALQGPNSPTPPRAIAHVAHQD